MSCYDAYGAIARVYDRLNAEIDYAAWADFVEACFSRYLNDKPELLLDLACGTGSMTLELARRGFDMIGVDASPDMLSVACERAADRECEGVLTFSRAFLFTSFMYLFAAMFVTIAHYIYFRYMDNGLIVTTYQDMLNQMSGMATAEMKASLDQFQQALDIIATLSPLEISIQLITQNVFYCTLIALPTALLVRKQKPNSPLERG